MHDGSLKTLWDVMDHYNKGGETNAYLDGGIEPLNLSENEINDVVAFLFALTDGRFAAQNDAALREQQQLAAKSRPFRDNALAHREMLPFEQRVMGPAGLPVSLR
jgi:cytochrome c peroxidase